MLIALGAAHDLWRADHPPRPPARGDARGAAARRAPESAPAPAGDARRNARSPGAEEAALGPASDAPIDLNRANAAELEALPGIGPVLAARIVSHRESHGRFVRIEDLLGVRGVGPRLFARLRSRVHVGAAVQTAASRDGRRADSGSVAPPTAR
jgi:competence protein ComEA